MSADVWCRAHPAMGRHGIKLVHVSWALLSTWRMICGITHAAHPKWVNADAEIIFILGPTSVSLVLHTGVWSILCLLLVWCPMAFNHQQTWYGNYILQAECYHVLNEWSMLSSVLWGWGMIYDQCCVCWWSDSRLHSIMGRRSVKICIVYPVLCHVQDLYFHLHYVH